MKSEGGGAYQPKPSGQLVEKKQFRNLIVENLPERPPTFMQDAQGAKAGQALVGMHPGGQGINPINPEKPGDQQDEEKKAKLPTKRKALGGFFLFGFAQGGEP